MIAALYIALAIVVVGILLWLHERCYRKRKNGTDSAEDSAEGATETTENECCGMHIICEKDSLLSSVSDEIVYYDDEELDVYRGRGADDYSYEEIEQFRDVLLTLIPEDIAGWGRSVQLRGITLPTPVRDELLMIVAEARKM